MSKNNKTTPNKKTEFKFKVPIIKIVDGKPVEEFVFMSKAELDDIANKANSGMKDFLGEKIYEEVQQYKKTKEKKSHD